MEVIVNVDFPCPVFIERVIVIKLDCLILFDLAAMVGDLLIRHEFEDLKKSTRRRIRKIIIIHDVGAFMEGTFLDAIR